MKSMKSTGLIAVMAALSSQLEAGQDWFKCTGGTGTRAGHRRKQRFAGAFGKLPEFRPLEERSRRAQRCIRKLK